MKKIDEFNNKMANGGKNRQKHKNIKGVFNK